MDAVVLCKPTLASPLLDWSGIHLLGGELGMKAALSEDSMVTIVSYLRQFL